MKKINIRDDKINKLLNNISDEVFKPETLNSIISTARGANRRCDLIKDSNGWEDEYLYKAFKYKISDFGYPRSALMISETNSEPLYNAVHSFVNKLSRKLGVKSNALSALYPKKGYIGWHHNGNAPGYNILFSYSMDGNGRFKYYDYETGKIVNMEDEPGWNAKVGYYPDERKEPNRVYWHEAETENPRLSIAFVVYDRDIWESMIKDITSNNFDSQEILSQGPR